MRFVIKEKRGNSRKEIHIQRPAADVRRPDTRAPAPETFVSVIEGPDGSWLVD